LIEILGISLKFQQNQFNQKEKKMEVLHLVEIRYLAPTNTKGARIRLKSLRFREGITIPYDYSKNSILDIGVEFLQDLGVSPKFVGETPDGYIIGIEEFTPIKKINKKEIK
jgi:hypothetical protein